MSMRSLINTCMVFLALATMACAGDPPTAGGLKVGDTAPDFNLKNVDGKMISMESFPDAKGFVIIFTCNHCPFSIAYEDRIIELHNKYNPDYPVIAINPNDPAAQPADSFEKMKERASEKAFPFVYLFDDGQKVFPQYGAKKTPHVYLLDKNKTVQYIGAIDDSARNEDGVEAKYLEGAIMAMDKGDMIDPSFTKAVGCSIKVKKG